MATKPHAQAWRQIVGPVPWDGVLVVDDGTDVEALFRQQFRREVREGHCLLDFALSGKVALNKLVSCVGNEIVLLLSDISMPGMSGLDLPPIVKTCRPDLPVFNDLGLWRRGYVGHGACARR